MAKTPPTPDNRDLDEILDLLCVDIQLDPTRFDRAKTGYTAVSKWLGADDSLISIFRPDIFPQGSLRIDTTVKPLKYTEFDLDLVCLVGISANVTPAAVYELLLSRMRSHSAYDKIIVEMPRCIRLDYRGDFHLDIVPAIPDPNCPPNESWIMIPDRERRVWLSSNPRGYGDWLEKQAKKRKLVENLATYSEKYARIEPLLSPVPALSKPPLKLAIQLLKRWRDVAFKGRETLAPSSIILTTLAGHLYDGDLHPTETLLTILNGIHRWANAEAIHLQNPSNPGEWITDRWQQKPQMYAAFLDAIFDLRAKWQKLVGNGRFPHMLNDLKELFDEATVEKAVIKFAERRTEARKAGNLTANRTTGSLSIGPAAVATVPVRDHTFHGSR